MLTPTTDAEPDVVHRVLGDMDYALQGRVFGELLVGTCRTESGVL